jgi:hypothetical protein
LKGKKKKINNFCNQKDIKFKKVAFEKKNTVLEIAFISDKKIDFYCIFGAFLYEKCDFFS